MDTSKILTDLRAERDRIDQAITALESLGGAKPLGGGHNMGPFPSARPAAVLATAKPGRNISAAGRKRIADAARKMWAERRKGAKAVAKKAAPGGRTMSPDARKRIGEAMKKRWAEKKKAATA
jgi:hypothetical protein